MVPKSSTRWEETATHGHSSPRAIFVLRQLLHSLLRLGLLQRDEVLAFRSVFDRGVFLDVSLLDLSDDGGEMTVRSKFRDGSLSLNPSIDDVDDGVSDGK